MNYSKFDEVIILVHGTFSSDQKGWASMKSEFCKNLDDEYLKLTSAKLKFISFKWSGLNSLYERQSAGTKLAEFINLNGLANCRIHLIGHSHGGSVIQYALQQKPYSVPEEWKNNVASWITIGTPFYRFKGNYKLKDNTIFHLTSPLCLVLLLLAIFILNLKALSLLLFIPFFIVSYVLVNGFLNAKSLQFRLKTANKIHAHKWFGITSEYDEALIGLINNAKFVLPKTKRKIPSLDSDYNPFTTLAKFSSVIIYNYFTMYFYMPFLANKIRNLSLGLDRLFYKVDDIALTPCENIIADVLSEDVENELLSNVLEDNKEKISSLRRLMSINNHGVMNELFAIKGETAPKLIHTTYFDNLNIVKAIAKHLAELKLQNTIT